MGWGNILLTWPRYAKNKSGKNCERCHLNFSSSEESCPYCSHLDDQELQMFLKELETKNNKNNILFIMLISVLLLYAIIVLFVLPLIIK